MANLAGLQSAVADIFSASWETRSGQVVPDPENLRLGNDAVEFDRATVLYADLQGSTRMVDSEPWWRSAEIYKTFLHCAATIIRNEGGAITSYDGDRVMGIWVGKRQTTPAAIAGLKINFVVQNVINPAFQRRYPDTTLEVKQVVGIDTSAVRAARTGVRGGNDIVWVGRAANYAAKLTIRRRWTPTSVGARRQAVSDFHCCLILRSPWSWRNGIGRRVIWTVAEKWWRLQLRTIPAKPVSWTWRRGSTARCRLTGEMPCCQGIKLTKHKYAKAHGEIGASAPCG